MADSVKILIVDDNAAMRATIRKVVGREGDEFFECGDGKDALHEFQCHQPDWVLMDISMKGVTGIEATESIVHADPSARVLIVTDHGDRFFRRAAREAGAKGFVMKENLHDIDSYLRTHS